MRDGLLVAALLAWLQIVYGKHAIY